MSVENRVFGIIEESDKSHVEDLLKLIINYDVAKNIYIFSKNPSGLRDLGDIVQVVELPQDLDTRPKLKNFAIRFMKQNSRCQYVHLIEDRIELLKDPTDFINSIEKMMEVLEINNYFGTITDGCNYVYSKYNPRLRFSLDDEKYKNLGMNSDILLCSHSNVQWIAIDISRADDNEMYFDESFKIDMFWIIEFLARRRNSHPGSAYYMNWYITSELEKGIYRLDNDSRSKYAFDSEKMMSDENVLFKSKCSSYSQDGNLDIILENLYLKISKYSLNSKIS